MASIDEIRGEKILVRFDGDKCIHSRECVLAQPEVFVPHGPGYWIHPDNATPEELVAVAHRCPSGAITYERLDGGPAETPPKVNVVRVREDGPLAFHAALELQGHGSLTRATLCRCGASQHKPFCDNSHVTLGFRATGEPPTEESTPPAARDGTLRVTPLANGPLKCAGNLELVSGTGRTVKTVTKTALCRCGHSEAKPFCDGSHAVVGFQSE